jgi:hypothetical protein
MILAYRNNLEKYRTKVKSMLDKLSEKKYLLEINLESLTTEEVKTMLREVFSGDFENTDELVSLDLQKNRRQPIVHKTNAQPAPGK